MNTTVTATSSAVARRRAATRRRVRSATDSCSTVRMGAAGAAAVGSIPVNDIDEAERTVRWGAVQQRSGSAAAQLGDLRAGRGDQLGVGVRVAVQPPAAVRGLG